MKISMHKAVERICLGLGFFGLAVVGWAYADSWAAAHQARAALKDPTNPIHQAPPDTGMPLALLSIERLDMEVPVFPGTDRLTLNRGAGVVEGTSLPGEPGNVVISAHRDSFFRPLESIATGDHIELMVRGQAKTFTVVETFVTDPLDLSVLEPSEGDQLTLVTCYPFRYVGFAPDRFIVRAVALAHGEPKLTSNLSNPVTNEGNTND